MRSCRAPNCLRTQLVLWLDVLPTAAPCPILSPSNLPVPCPQLTAARSLRHPNVVQIMGLCAHPPCLVTEFCERGSLTDCLRAARGDPAVAAQLTWRRRLTMAIDAALGMAYLHSRSIVHRCDGLERVGTGGKGRCLQHGVHLPCTLLLSAGISRAQTCWSTSTGGSRSQVWAWLPLPPPAADSCSKCCTLWDSSGFGALDTPLLPPLPCCPPDFNLSKIVSDATHSSSQAAMNPRWLAPEVMQVGSRPRGRHLWAGCLLNSPTHPRRCCNRRAVMRAGGACHACLGRFCLRRGHVGAAHVSDTFLQFWVEWQLLTDAGHGRGCIAALWAVVLWEWCCTTALFHGKLHLHAPLLSPLALQLGAALAHHQPLADSEPGGGRQPAGAAPSRECAGARSPASGAAGAIHGLAAALLGAKSLRQALNARRC